MKTLVLIRHGKSEWGDSAPTDFERSLNKRGLRDAPVMADRLRTLGVIPDLIISSPAVRALTTAELMAEAYNMPSVEINEIPDLYLASSGELERILKSTVDDVNTLFLVAHNPGISSLASKLFSQSVQMPTTCATVCRIEGSWKDFRVISWDILKPKEKIK